MISFQKRGDNATVRWNLIWTILAAGVVLMSGCEPLGLWNEEDSGPRIEMSTQEVDGTSTMVQGDTIIFRPVSADEAPCHFYLETCDLPPIPIEEKQGMIHLKRGYFLVPAGDVPLQGEVNRNGSEIEIRVWPDFEAGGAHRPDNIVPYTYEARVRGLSPGTYNLRAVHEYDQLRVIQGSNEEGTPAVVADTTVTVE